MFGFTVFTCYLSIMFSIYMLFMKYFHINGDEYVVFTGNNNNADEYIDYSDTELVCWNIGKNKQHNIV